MRQRRLPGKSSLSNAEKRRELFNSVALSKGSSSAPTSAFPKYPAYSCSSGGGASATAAAELDSLWIAGFLDHAASVQDEQTTAKLRSLLSLPGSDILPLSEGILKPQQSNKATNDDESGMSLEEKERLDAARHRLITKRLRCVQRPESKVQVKPKPRRAFSTPYHMANAKIGKVLRLRPHIHRPAAMQSDLLEHLVQVNREEVAAAIAIQAHWRRCLSIGRLQTALLSYRSAKAIQTIVRGHLARLRVHRMRERLLRAALRCQRQYRCRKVWCRWRHNQLVERWAATKCQSIARVWLAVGIIAQICQQHAATKLQTVWRGYQSRQLRDRLWFYKNATIIQCWRRKVLAQRFVKRLHQMKDTAATHVGRWWRGHCARMRRDDLLYHRTIEARSNQVRVLAAQDQFWSERVTELEKRMAPDDEIKEWKKSLVELPSKASALEEQIQTDERLLVEQRALRQNLSPRSVEQGWLEQVERNITSTRDSITKSKLELVFGVRRTIRQAENDLQRRTDEVKNARETRDRVAKWKDEELNELWDCQRGHDKAERIKSRAQAIADERRRWKVKWTVPSGKPEKDEGALAEQRKARVERSVGAFCGGAVDLLADIDMAGKRGTDQPSKEYQLLKKLAKTVKLRSHQNETLAFDTLLDPILKKMRDGPAETMAKNLAPSVPRRVDESARMGSEVHTKARAEKTTKPRASARRGTNSPAIPRSMPFADLHRIRTERAAFERHATSIQTDANCSRWMNEECWIEGDGYSMHGYMVGKDA